MLRNMKLGTKLLAVILPPLIVLVVVAGIGARDRLDQSADARAAEQYIELASSTSALITTMQWERNVSLFVLAGGEDATDFLSERRERTNRELDRHESAASAVNAEAGSELADLVERSLGRRSDLESFRSSIDRDATDVWIIQSFFDNAIDDHLNLISEVSNTVPVVEVSADLASFTALIQAKEQSARTAATFTIALTHGEFDAGGRLWRSSRDAQSGFDRYLNLFYDISPAELTSTLRGAVGSSVSQQAEDMRLRIVTEVAPTVFVFEDGAAGGEPLQLDYNPAEWVDLAEARLNAMNRVGDAIIAEVSAFVTDLASDAERAALLFLLVTAAAVLLSGILAVVVARRVTKPLRELTVAADRLSGEQLPALVERLRSPTAQTGGVLLEPINMRRNDEIGRLADAFDSIQRVTVEVAEEQATLLKKGIGDIFVNLARRNQTLLDRQIEFIDQLESAEEDPDVLEDLFKLDHLATRMRRNAESLLVLAGVETGHRRSKPVPLADVVRVAIGEVEDFARLNLLALDDAMVTGTAAMDVAHMLSELMENATSFSPPETNVEILGHQSKDGGYVISISDQGIGMSEEQFAEANRLLAEPPLVGLTLSRSLGFTVVGRLATRFNVSVRLTQSPTGGVTALVTLPDSILQVAKISVTPDEPAQVETPAEPEPVAEVAPELEPTPQHQATPTLEDVFADAPVLDLEPDEQIAPPNEPAPDWVAPAPAASSLASAMPEGAAFDAGLAALMGDDNDAPTADERSTVDDDAPSIFSDGAAEETVPSAEAESLTSAGLVRRVPRANTPVDEQTERPGTNSSVAASQRSPEEVRAMLSRYRSGLQRANQPGDGNRPSDSGSNGSN